jgi:hypothetical protein
MASSTLHFKARFPAVAASFLLTAAVAWGICILYTLILNPEIRYDVHGAIIKNRWADKMSSEYGAKVVIYGGSSCAFSIDGERMLRRFNLPTVNEGRAAGMGAAILTESVLGGLHPGDTLIVAIEPQLLAKPFEPAPEGIQFSFAVHHPEWVLHPVVAPSPTTWFQALDAMRPGSIHTFTLFGKIVGRRPLFRYQFSDYRSSGWEQSSVRMKFSGPLEYEPSLSNDGRNLLRNLRSWCNKHQIRVAYSLPWSYSLPEKEAAYQRKNIALLIQISDFMPVLKDDHFGADTNIEHFGDTLWHLNQDGSALRTDGLGEQIKNWDTWSVIELSQRRAGI